MSAKDKHGLFDFRGVIPAPPPVLTRAEPDRESLCMLTSMEDVRGAVRRAASNAQRLMSILTEDLEPEIYDHPVFLDTVKRFVLSRSFAKVRVLLHDASRMIGNSNRFVGMSRRLASCIEIRVVAPGWRASTQALLIADEKAIVYRPRSDSWTGVAGFNQPPIVRMHLQEFDQMWLASAPEADVRRAAI
ncbi:MAG: hypothetical protein ABW136_05755 [Steroidobacteraceae bacterium]